MKYYIGIDLGGTNIVAGLVDHTGKILQKTSAKTLAPRSPEAICDDIKQLCERILRREDIAFSDVEWIGIGSPGTIHDGMIDYANNLKFFDVPLADILKKRVRRPVFLQNDANTAAYGEFVFGCGRQSRSLVAVTLGTGVGGGIVFDGKIHEGFNGAAAELGHIVVEASGRTCSCGKIGCLEAYCSATALKKQTEEKIKVYPDSIMTAMIGGDYKNITGKTAFDAMRTGDRAGAEVVDAFIFYLSLGVSNIINILQPEILCIGGGISKEGDTIIKPVNELVAKQTYVNDSARRTKIVAASLGNDAGLIGAAMLGLQPN